MTILEVSNFPEMGVLAVKYRDEHGNTGITERAAIDTATHTAVWNQTYSGGLFYDIHTNDVKKCDMHLSVRHITPGSQKETKIGIVNINLSEFLDSQRKLVRSYYRGAAELLSESDCRIATNDGVHLIK